MSPKAVDAHLSFRGRIDLESAFELCPISIFTLRAPNPLALRRSFPSGGRSKRLATRTANPGHFRNRLFDGLLESARTITAQRHRRVHNRTFPRSAKSQIRSGKCSKALLCLGVTSVS